MAEFQVESIKFKSWILGSTTRIKLNNAEIEEIDMASKPLAAVLSLLPKVGTAIGIAIVSYMYWIKRQNNSDAKQGAVIEITNRIDGFLYGRFNGLPKIKSVSTWTKQINN